MLNAVGEVDLIIPRGSKQLIDFVRNNSRVPVIETGAGVCHTYVHESGLIDYAREIVLNAKTRRVSVCNSLDTLVIDRARLTDLPQICAPLAEKGVTIYADDEAFASLEGKYEKLEHATADDFGREWLDYKMSIKTIADIDEAIEFLSNFNFKNWPDAQRKANTIRYLRYLSSEDNERPLKYVYFYQMSYKAGPRHRNFDKEKCRLATNTELFAGPSSAKDSTNYPGDRKIVGGEDTLTIQLHNIEFDGASLDYPRRAYTLAIYYPSALATNYYANEENTDDEE
jgi:hypothetical protein